MGILELLTIVFLVLKLTEVIDWSWWLVFAPMYVYLIAFVIWLVLAFFIGVINGIMHVLVSRKFRK